MGITRKITSDILATTKISTKKYKKELQDTYKNPFKPFEATYNYISKDVTKFIDEEFNVGMWIRHKVHLKDIKIRFEGSSVKIFTSYRIDLALDYEQSVIPSTKAMKAKGLLKGRIEVDVHLVGSVSIDNKAQVLIKASEKETKVEFTKILLPAAIDALGFLKITQTEDYLRKKLLEERVNKYIFNKIQEQISKKQIDIQLAQKIQTLVYENSQALNLSKDLWLVPHAEKISISQITADNKKCSNTLSVNVGVIAKPKLITSSLKPVIDPPKSIPIVCEELSPKIYLYPKLNIKYAFVASLIEGKLQNLINKEYVKSEYNVKNVHIYPSDKKLVIGIDLVEKENSQKLLSFYLWGTPKLKHEFMNVSLEDLDYTIESKSYLLNVADWLLDDRIKTMIQDEAVFNYKDKFMELSDKLSKIEHKSTKKVITGKLNLIGIENIFTAKESLVIHALATGNISYQVNFKK